MFDTFFQFLYVMEISVDIKSSKNNMKIVSISEILLQSPMLNMIILNAKIDHNEVNFIEQSKSSNNMYFISNKQMILVKYMLLYISNSYGNKKERYNILIYISLSCSLGTN